MNTNYFYLNLKMKLKIYKFPFLQSYSPNLIKPYNTFLKNVSHPIFFTIFGSISLLPIL